MDLSILKSKYEKEKLIYDISRGTKSLPLPKDNIELFLYIIAKSQLGLEFSAPVNKIDLYILVSQTALYKEYKYVSSTWNTFETALEIAKEVLESESSNQEAVDSALTDLKNAKGGLIKKGNATKLNLLYLSCKDIQQGEYTNTTWDTFVSARESARVILQSLDYSQNDIDTVYNDLLLALEGLSVSEVSLALVGSAIVGTSVVG